MGILVRMDDYISSNVRHVDQYAHSTRTAGPGGVGSQSESWRYFFLISSAVASSAMSRISYGLGDVRRHRAERAKDVLQLEGFQNALYFHLALESVRLAVEQLLNLAVVRGARPRSRCLGGWG